MQSQARPNRPIVIAGPCSAETPEQIEIALQEAKKRNIDFVRISLWKPRTKPGFDGLKEEGIPLLLRALELGINPGTEVLTGEQAQTIVDAVLPHMSENQRLMLWIGARNQNHLVQQDIARVCAQDPRILMMAKNQPWPSQDHWEGIASHMLSGRIAASNVYMCHRGFTTGVPHPLNLRNTPDSEMAMRVRANTGLQMLLDISHIAGCRSNIRAVAHDAVHYEYDGIVIEVHHDPANAWTDAKQQITWDTLDELLVEIGLAGKAAPKQPEAEKAVALV